MVGILYLQIRRPPRATRTDPLFPSTPLCRSGRHGRAASEGPQRSGGPPGRAILKRSGREEPQRSGGGENSPQPGVAGRPGPAIGPAGKSQSEENTSELQSLMRTTYAVFCLKKKKERIDYQ